MNLVFINALQQDGVCVVNSRSHVGNKGICHQCHFVINVFLDKNVA